MIKTIDLPTKAERHKRFGSVPPIKGSKPTDKEKMPDLQNTPNDFLFAINSVGICNVKHPVIVHSELEPKVQTTIATFALTTSLNQMSKGINMSRLTELLQQYHEEGFVLSFDHLQRFTKELAEKMEQTSATLEVTFPWFFERKSPALDKVGLMHADAKMKVTYNSDVDQYTYETGLTGAVTTLCPCSKEISEYSAHNQRGYVRIETVLYSDSVCDKDWKKALLDAAETNASAKLHPILKRPDEKLVTENAYENPRFVEDMVRLVAADLYENPLVKAFTVECRNEESIHVHDAIATITYEKE
ncbi:GTP cyclohydrolase I FolE2 [Anaerobacillus alkaliphilus]|uniref:GTP cyclohydrolase FolE2 n=1 Tax=Anaerobacillus alkaliphilus TaxID=1548597 RepID=A0A4Q0W266_9BACI|nr:GTP cyclohydrolase FolE2 [Anaerobacillus alkaliphilus]RXJ04631.1 GTP cyclohydrolase I FolE2 [Anaerobacillus alkaliphilus]